MKEESGRAGPRLLPVRGEERKSEEALYFRWIGLGYQAAPQTQLRSHQQALGRQAGATGVLVGPFSRPVMSGLDPVLVNIISSIAYVHV